MAYDGCGEVDDGCMPQQAELSIRSFTSSCSFAPWGLAFAPITQTDAGFTKITSDFFSYRLSVAWFSPWSLIFTLTVICHSHKLFFLGGAFKAGRYSNTFTFVYFCSLSLSLPFCVFYIWLCLQCLGPETSSHMRNHKILTLNLKLERYYFINATDVRRGNNINLFEKIL